MYIEKEQLKERYLKGREFTFTQMFRKLPEVERQLLRKQLDTMESYMYTLTQLIDMEEKKAANMVHNQAMFGSDLVGGKVVKVDSELCDNCPNEPGNCVKLYLVGGGYICIDEPERPQSGK